MKIGILGAGRVVSWFLNDLPFNKYKNQIKVVGIYDLNIEKAKTLAYKYEINKIYQSFEEFLTGNFDLVYVGTSEQTHYQISKKLLDKKFNVYCEKPIALAYNQAKELYQKAKEHKCIFFDGIKTPFSPAYREMKKQINQNVIGKIILIHTSHTKVSTSLKIPNPSPNQKTGGYHLGAGMYALFPALDLGGEIQEFNYLANSYPQNKAIATSAFLIRHKSGTISTVVGSDHTTDNAQAVIQGSKGYITLGGKVNKYNQPYQKDSIHMAHSFEIRGLDHHLIKQVDIPFATNGEGLMFALEHVYEMWINNQIFSSIISPKISLSIIKILEDSNQIR